MSDERPKRCACGHEASMSVLDSYPAYYRVCCDVCGKSAGADTWEDAVAQWNRPKEWRA